MNYTEHQIQCVRKYCDDYAAGIENWPGCKFPAGQHFKYPCPTHSQCREEIEGGLRMARLTPPTAHSQERANPSSSLAEPLPGASAPPIPSAPTTADTRENEHE